MLNREIQKQSLIKHTLCMTTVKMYLHRKEAKQSGIATNTMALYGPISGIFANSVVLLDHTELAKLKGNILKVVLRDEMEFISSYQTKTRNKCAN